MKISSGFEAPNAVGMATSFGGGQQQSGWHQKRKDEMCEMALVMAINSQDGISFDSHFVVFVSPFDFLETSDGKKERNRRKEWLMLSASLGDPT